MHLGPNGYSALFFLLNVLLAHLQRFNKASLYSDLESATKSFLFLFFAFSRKKFHSAEYKQSSYNVLLKLLSSV